MVTASFTGRVKTLSIEPFEGQTGIVFPLINWTDIGVKHTPQNCIIDGWSAAITQLQLNYYIPGVKRPTELPKIDEVSQTLVEQLSKDLDWKEKFNPNSQYAIEIGLFEKFGNDSWEQLSRKWLYNQGLERFDDLLNPYLNNVKATDYGDILNGYQLGLAVIRRPNAAITTGNYLKVRCGYSGVVEFRELPRTITLQSYSEKLVLIKNQVQQVLGNRANRKTVFLTNTGNSNLYFNFDSNLTNVDYSPLLKPGEVFSYESGKLTWSGEGSKYIPPNVEHQINTGVYVITDGKTSNGENGNKFTCSVLEQWGE